MNVPGRRTTEGTPPEPTAGPGGPGRPSDDRPADADVIGLLRSHHGTAPVAFEHLHGGFWSAAYGYRIGDDDLVLRLNADPQGFRSDRVAMHYSSFGIPVPEVLAIGKALGRWFAISRRARGCFLEDFEPQRATTLAPTLSALLANLRAVPDSGSPVTPWRDWLLEGLNDRPNLHTSGWSNSLAAHPAAQQVFDTADARIRASLDVCADHRQLVHGDLLHRNVLVAPSGDAVTAVFSWKCSTWGDSAYDLAWCTFWGRWHHGIGELDLWNRVVPALAPSDAQDIAERHYAYELHIGATHLGWYSILGDAENLAWTTLALEDLLASGPRPLPK